MAKALSETAVQFVTELIDLTRDFPVVAVALASLAVAGFSVFAVYKVCVIALDRGRDQ